MEATEQNENRDTAVEPSAEIERLRQELAREHDMYLRSLADFDNYRRRVERDRATAGRAGKREIMLPLLEVLDGFDRALSHMNEAPSGLAVGLQALHRKLLGLLEAQGITPLATVGETFNPEFHEAMGSVNSEDVEPGTIAEELQRGYRWGDEVLRPARVRVAR
jgi:molecular chaperone GrpE